MTPSEDHGARWVRLANLALGLWVLVSIAVWNPSRSATMWIVGLLLSASSLARRGAAGRMGGAALGIWLGVWSVIRDRATESMSLVASNLIVAILIVVGALVVSDD